MSESISRSVVSDTLLTLWTVAHQAPLSIEISGENTVVGCQLPSPGNLPNPGIEPRSPTLQADSSPSEPPEAKVSIQVFYPFSFMLLFSHCWILKILCIFWITVLYQICLMHFLPICGLSSHFLDCVFHITKVFNFNEIQLINYFFQGPLILYLKSHCNAQVYLDFLQMTSRSFIVLYFTFRPIIHF